MKCLFIHIRDALVLFVQKIEHILYLNTCTSYTLQSLQSPPKEKNAYNDYLPKKRPTQTSDFLMSNKNDAKVGCLLPHTPGTAANRDRFGQLYLYYCAQ